MADDGMRAAMAGMRASALALAEELMARGAVYPDAHAVLPDGRSLAAACGKQAAGVLLGGVHGEDFDAAVLPVDGGVFHHAIERLGSAANVRRALDNPEGIFAVHSLYANGFLWDGGYERPNTGRVADFAAALAASVGVVSELSVEPGEGGLADWSGPERAPSPR